MTTRKTMNASSPPVEVRLLIPADQYEDLRAISKVKGLATTQFARSVILEYLNRLYVKAATKTGTP